MVIYCGKYHHTVCGFYSLFTTWITSLHVNSDMHAGVAGINNSSGNLHHIANRNGFEETNTTNIYSYTISAAPVGCTGVTGLVNPLHYSASMHFAAKVTI